MPKASASAWFFPYTERRRAAFAAAHTLKGVSGNLSFNRLYGRVAAVVEPLRCGDLEAARKLLPELSGAFEEIRAVLEELKI